MAVDEEESSDDSDEWGMAELVIPPPTYVRATKDDYEPDKDDQDYWKVEPKKEEPTEKVPTVITDKPSANIIPPGEPMIIVDITQMDSTIHSKFDRNSVNNAEAASAIRKKIESNYAHYARDSSLLAQGVVIPCGSSVWRDALVRLRDERPGHYFAPIFPPKTTKR